MPKYYLLGGENVVKRDAQDVNRQAFMDAGKLPQVLVFPWARASFDRAYQKRKALSDYFRSLGASSTVFVDYYSKIEYIKNRMAESDLVYLTGGLPSVLIERLRKMGVDTLLGSFEGVIVGRSAGALALCRKCIVTCKSNSAIKIVDGLGLVNLTLKVHYRKGKIDGQLKEMSKEQEIFAVPKGSALVYNNGGLSFINKVYSFKNSSRQKLN